MNNTITAALQSPKVTAMVAAVTTGAGIDGWILKNLPDYLSIIAMSLGIVLAVMSIISQYRLAKKTKLETKILNEQTLKNKQDE